MVAEETMLALLELQIQAEVLVVEVAQELLAQMEVLEL